MLDVGMFSCYLSKTNVGTGPELILDKYKSMLLIYITIKFRNI